MADFEVVQVTEETTVVVSEVTTVVTTDDAPAEIILNTEETTVVLSESAPAEIISEGLIGPPGPAGPPGPQGVQGPAGPGGSVEATTLAGYPIVMDDLTSFDLVQFGSNGAWVNSSLLDGGNF